MKKGTQYVTLRCKPSKVDILHSCQVTKEKKTLKVSFQSKWLKQFPWLCYSYILEGGICCHCTLFLTELPREKHQVYWPPYTRLGVFFPLKNKIVELYIPCAFILLCLYDKFIELINIIFTISVFEIGSVWDTSRLNSYREQRLVFIQDKLQFSEVRVNKDDLSLAQD